MTVKCILLYYDTELKRVVEPDEVLTVKPERAKRLLSAGICVEVEEVKKPVKKRGTK